MKYKVGDKVSVSLPNNVWFEGEIALLTTKPDTYLIICFDNDLFAKLSDQFFEIGEQGKGKTEHTEENIEKLFQFLSYVPVKEETALELNLPSSCLVIREDNISTGFEGVIKDIKKEIGI